MNVYLVAHWHPLPDNPSSSLTIGVYSSREKAEAAVKGLASQPGFRDFPDVLEDPSETGGFNIEECELDRTWWQEGFVID
jgi:homoserine kinase type II